MITNPNLSLKALRAFAFVVENRSISAAARKMNIATSAVAASVNQVEAEVGAKLLVRSRAHGVSPTEQAIALATQFRNLLEEYSQILDQGRSWASELSGTLRIGYYAPIAPAFLPKLLVPIMQSSPKLQLSMSEHNNDNAQAALLAGELDLIIFTGRDLKPGIDTTTLMELQPYVLVAAGHPLAKRDRLTLQEVGHYPIVQLDLPVARSYVNELFHDAGVVPNVVANANSTEMVRSLVGAGLGIAILSMRPRTTYSYGGNILSTIPLSPSLTQITLHAGKISGRPRHVVGIFLNALKHWCASPDVQNVKVGQYE